MLTVAELEREQRLAERTKWLHAYGVCGDVRYKAAHRQELDDSRRLAQQMHGDATPAPSGDNGQPYQQQQHLQHLQQHKRVRPVHMVSKHPFQSASTSAIFFSNTGPSHHHHHYPHRGGIRLLNSSTPIKCPPTAVSAPLANNTVNSSSAGHHQQHSAADDADDPGHLRRQQQRELEQLQRKKEAQRQIALMAMHMAEDRRRQQQHTNQLLQVAVSSAATQTVGCNGTPVEQLQRPPAVVSMSEERIKAENMRRVKIARIQQHMLEMQQMNGAPAAAAAAASGPPPQQLSPATDTVWLAASAAARKLEFKGLPADAAVDTTGAHFDSAADAGQNLMMLSMSSSNNINNGHLIIRYDRAELMRLQSVLMMPNVRAAAGRGRISCWAPSGEMCRRWPQLLRMPAVRTSSRYFGKSNSCSAVQMVN